MVDLVTTVWVTKLKSQLKLWKILSQLNMRHFCRKWGLWKVVQNTWNASILWFRDFIQICKQSTIRIWTIVLDTIQNECVGQISKLYLINLANMPPPYTKPPFSHFKTFQSWVACNPSTYASQFSSYSPKSGSPWPSLKQKDHKSSSASVRQDKKIIREIGLLSKN